jgi:hypothetical protein
MEIEWSKTRANTFYMGGFGISQHTFIEPLRILNDSLSKISSYHVDIRELKTYKKRNKNGSIEGWVYQGNDGGITKGAETGIVHWTDISRQGLNITQYYGIGIPGNGSGLVIGGTQDGNIDYIRNSTYKNQVGDAGEVVFDHNNLNNVYRVTFMTGYYGVRSIDGGETFPLYIGKKFNIADPKRRNDAPLEISQNDTKRLYIGGLDVWRTKDGFVTDPLKISNLVKNDQTHIAIKTIREAKSNSNVLYVVRDNPHWNCNDTASNCDRRRLFKTMNGLLDTPDWFDITPSTTFVPLGESAFSDLAVNPYNEHEFYISMTRSIPGKQVYKGSGTSTISWENISTGLPALPVNCLLYRNGSSLNELFAGTDAGVYYRNDSLDSWVPFGNGMPLTVISDLNIDYTTNELYASTFGRGIYKASLCFDPINFDPIFISNNEVWNDKIVTDDVIIITGAQLTILGTVQMGRDRHIVVQKGGKLIVNGGKITNGCSNHPWKGITLQGTSSGTQNPLDQGIVHLFNGSIIENAIIGIHCVNPAIPIDGSGSAGEPSSLVKGGGIVFAYESRFVNNQVAVQFEKYDKNSISRFERCTFEINGSLLPGINPVNMSRFNEVSGINVLGCTFKVSSSHDKLINGIYAYHSSFAVDRKCSGDNCSEQTLSSFENLNYAVYSLSRTGGKTFSVRYANFTKNRRGVFANSTENLRISNNNFFMYSKNPFGDNNISGIYLDKCTGYIVEENELRNMETIAGYITYGMYINNSGTANNMVYNNKLFNCNYGITALDKNRNADGSAGLLLKCNQFTNVKMDIAVIKTIPNATGMGIAASQGSYNILKPDCKDPAGNLFSLLTINDYWSIRNECEPIDYYHHNPASMPRVEPTNTINTKLYDTGLNFSIETCCPPNTTGGGSSSIDEVTLAYKSEADTASILLTALIDDGNTDNKVVDVNLAFPSEAMLVRDDLLQISPYVSDTVIKTAINREELLNNAMLRDIMVANPHSAKSEPLMQELDMRLDPMPEYMRDEILEGVFLLSDKELLEARRNMNQSLYQYGFNRLLSACLSDSTTMHVDSLITLLSADGSFNSLLKQAWILLETGDTTGALNQISNIRSQLELTSEEYNELNQQQSYLQWIIANPIVDEIATETLVNFMQSSSSSVSSAARSVLVANNMMVYDEPYLKPDLTKSIEIRTPKKISAIPSEFFLKVYPNPAKEFLTIEYNSCNENTDVAVELFDESGRKVYSQKLIRQFDAIILDTRNFKSGNYIVKLEVDNKTVKSSKVVIVR